METFVIKLSEPYDIDKLNEKVDYRPVKKMAFIALGIIALSTFIMFLGQTFNVMQFHYGDDQSMRLTELIGAAFIYGAVHGVFSSFKEAKETAQNIRRQKHENYEFYVIDPALKSVPEFASWHSKYFLNITYKGKAGSWSRLPEGDGFGTTYHGELDGSLLRITKQNAPNPDLVNA